MANRICSQSKNGVFNNSKLGINKTHTFKETDFRKISSRVIPVYVYPSTILYI